MRKWMPGLAMLAAAICPAQVTYKVSFKGQQSGQATLTQKLLDDGGKSVELTMTIRRGDKRVVVKTETTYGKDGALVRSEQRIFPFGQPAVKDTISTFDASGVTVEDKTADADTTSKFAAKAGQPTANPSTFWFLRVNPDVGQVCTAWVFNSASLKWEPCTFTYEGKTHRGQLVRMERAGKTVETAFGDDGYPNSIDDGAGMEMVRV